jgi:hypothetical protein
MCYSEVFIRLGAFTCFPSIFLFDVTCTRFKVHKLFFCPLWQLLLVLFYDFHCCVCFFGWMLVFFCRSFAFPSMWVFLLYKIW